MAAPGFGLSGEGIPNAFGDCATPVAAHTATTSAAVGTVFVAVIEPLQNQCPTRRQFFVPDASRFSSASIRAARLVVVASVQSYRFRNSLLKLSVVRSKCVLSSLSCDVAENST